MYDTKEIISYLQANKILYGIVQKAADSANRLRVQYPAFYSALYAKKLDMIYFLIEPRLQRAGALNARWASDQDIANIIARLVR